MTKGVTIQWITSSISVAWEYGKGTEIRAILRQSWNLTIPLANSLYARVRIGDGADIIPQSMLQTTMDWIQWKTSSTLHSAFFNAFSDFTSIPVPSMRPVDRHKNYHAGEALQQNDLSVSFDQVQPSNANGRPICHHLRRRRPQARPG